MRITFPIRATTRRIRSKNLISGRTQLTAGLLTCQGPQCTRARLWSQKLNMNTRSRLSPLVLSRSQIIALEMLLMWLCSDHSLKASSTSTEVSSIAWRIQTLWTSPSKFISMRLNKTFQCRLRNTHLWSLKLRFTSMVQTNYARRWIISRRWIFQRQELPSQLSRVVTTNQEIRSRISQRKSHRIRRKVKLRDNRQSWRGLTIFDWD